MRKLKCPKCGNETEFYTKERYSGTCDFYFRTDGKESENTDMYSNAEHKYRSKYIFCAECDSKVRKIDEYF